MLFSGRLPCPPQSQANRLRELISFSTSQLSYFELLQKAGWAKPVALLGHDFHLQDWALLGRELPPVLEQWLMPPFFDCFSQTCKYTSVYIPWLYLQLFHRLTPKQNFVPSMIDRGPIDKNQSICIPECICMIPLWMLFTWVSSCRRKNTGFTKKIQRFVSNNTKCLPT